MSYKHLKYCDVHLHGSTIKTITGSKLPSANKC